MADDIHPLAAGFPAADDAQWRDLAKKALNGADLERITRVTLDAVARGPLFTRAHLEEVSDPGAPGAAPFVRGLVAARDPYLPWGIRQPVDEPDPKKANAVILEELEGGASEISLRVDPNGETGVTIRTLDEMKIALDAVMLDLAPVYLAPSRMAPQYGAMLLALLEDSGLDPAKLRGGLGLSPIGQKSMAGGGAEKLATRLERTAEAAIYCRDRFPGVKTVAITATAPHEAGGSEAQEIAFVCAGGASYMRCFIDHGMSPDEAANALEFSMAADADIHLTIAKIRAARRAWARVAESFGVSPDKRGMRLLAVTSRRMLTARDPWTNLVRNTCAAFAAAAGGADSILTRPFTDALGAPTRFARRLARNLQIMLAEESHAGKVADPAGGGYLHETLGQRLAEAGWALFQQTESRGGLFETVKAGWLQGEIEKVREARRLAHATGRESLIGVSAFPVLEEKPVEVEKRSYAPPKLDAPVIEPQPFAEKIARAREGGQIRVLKLPEPQWAPLRPIRFAEPFEALRDAADAHAERSGKRPHAFLATIGLLSEFNARASFARGRLAVGGVETPDPDVYPDIEACTAAFLAAATPLAVICGTDEAYGQHAAALAARLKQAGAKEVWLAGRPVDIAGIHRFIHLRSHAVEDLKAAHQILGVA